MTRLTAADLLLTPAARPTRWEQLKLSFDHEEVVNSESIEDLVQQVLGPDLADDAVINTDPLHVLCSEASVDKLATALALGSGNDEIQRRNENVLRKLSSSDGRVRRLRRLACGWRADLDALHRTFPNFSGVLDYVRSMGALAELADGVIRLDPITLDGPPGTGKSTFAEELGTIVAGGFQRVQMSSAESGAQLGGSASCWSNSQTGLIFDTLMNSVYANPVVLLDELDKVPSQPGEHFSQIGPLYQLLEPPAARAFCDLSLPMLPIDASAVIWMATTNDRYILPAPMLNRMQVFEIAAPAPDQAAQVVLSVMRRLADAEPALARFSLAECAVSKLAAHAPRTVRALVRRACGTAAQTSRWIVYAHDVPECSPQRKPIGFRV